MGKQDTLLIKKIVREYTGFLKKTSELIDETKRVTALSLKKALKLEDGDQILINEDGSLEVETKKIGKVMSPCDTRGIHSEYGCRGCLKHTPF